ncbi:MAG TPA: hypothetical protein VK727_04085, partial [Steroidobacteraceae bacterium]|nr:hypothetical protein [Steroidobacteraceae bacterium]
RPEIQLAPEVSNQRTPGCLHATAFTPNDRPATHVQPLGHYRLGKTISSPQVAELRRYDVPSLAVELPSDIYFV